MASNLKGYNSGVAIVIPCFNQQDQLWSCLKSIEGDASFVDEIIIVDDGSFPQIQIPSDIFYLDKVRLIHTGKNVGIAAALNVGFSSTKARYIHRMDSDDLWVSGRIAAYDKAARATKSGLVSCLPTLITKDGCNWSELGKVSRPKNSGFLIKLYSYVGMPTVHPAIMFDRAVCGDVKYNESLSGIEDFELVRRVLAVHKMVVLDGSYLLYNTEGVSKDKLFGKSRNMRRIKMANKLVFSIFPYKIHENNAVANMLYYLRSSLMKALSLVDRRL